MTTIEFNSTCVNESRSLRHYAYQLTKDIEDANDLVQETLLKAFTYREKFTDTTNLKGWLYTIMKNSFINNYRRMVKRKTFIDSTDETYFINSNMNAVGNSGESNFIMKDIKKAISQLNDDLKTAFSLNHEGYKYHEIAELLHIPVGTVKTRIFVARRILRTKLSVYEESFAK